MSCKTSIKKTKIICSIGPASTDPEVMSKMVEAGMNVARINFSHATMEERAAVVASVHKVREMTGKNVAILYDTKGPEFRNGMMENDEIKLEEGKTIRIVKETVLGTSERFSVNHPQAIDNLEVGSIVLLENGLMKIEVISVEDDGVTCKIVNGGVLGNKKSLNAPGVKLDIPFISDVDREDIIYACQHEGDYIALSFVSRKEDVLAAREILKEYHREDMKVISKIESTTGVENLDSIIDVSDGIMVARGDLGVEVPMQQLPKFQKLMIQRCREKGKFVIVATEMLESMKKSARPTRAEVSDVANAYNLYQGIWIKHPAQNNLYPLSQKMKDAVVRDFLSRPTDIDSSQIQNYDQWLRLQFGHFFAEHFPIPYTKKYWMTEAKDLETRWMGSREGSRLYQPSVEEVIQGCNTSETPVTYYSKEMRYPRKGGFKQFLSALVENQDIRYNQQVISIDVENRLLRTSKGDEYQFDRLISSLPLPEVIKMLKNVPVDVCNAVARLHCTCGYQISVGLKTKNIPPYLWWYIYDEDILPARVYSPSLKSPDNVPEGCSSLQMEVYCNRNEYTREELLARSVGKLVSLNILKQEDILFTDIRFEPYANVIFDHNIYEARKTVRDYLFSLGIETIGRFGKWGYLWSDQSLMSGLKVEM